MKGSGGLSEIIVSSLEVGACASTYVDVCVCVPANWNMGSLQALEPELLGDSKGTL